MSKKYLGIYISQAVRRANAQSGYLSGQPEPTFTLVDLKMMFIYFTASKSIISCEINFPSMQASASEGRMGGSDFAVEALRLIEDGRTDDDVELISGATLMEIICLRAVLASAPMGNYYSMMDAAPAESMRKYLEEYKPMERYPPVIHPPVA